MFLDIQVTLQCGFTLKNVRDMIRTYSHVPAGYGSRTSNWQTKPPLSAYQATLRLKLANLLLTWLQETEAVVQRCSLKKMFLKISQNSRESTCVSVFFNKVAGKALSCSFIKKETLTQVFSYEFREILKNMFFHRTPPVAASEKINETWNSCNWPFIRIIFMSCCFTCLVK